MEPSGNCAIKNSTAVFVSFLFLVFGAWSTICIKRIQARSHPDPNKVLVGFDGSIEPGSKIRLFSVPQIPPAETILEGIESVFQGNRWGYARTLKALLIFTVMAMFFLSAGDFVLEKMFSVFRGSGVACLPGKIERFSYSYLLGSLIASFLWFGLAIAGRATAVCAILLGILGVLFFTARFASKRERILGWIDSFAGWWTHSSFSVKALFIIVSLTISITAFCAFLFQDFSDVLQMDLSLVYHHVYGGQILTPDGLEFYTHLPQNWWTLLCWPIALKSEMAAVLMGWSFYSVFCVLIWGFLRRFTGDLPALGGAWIFVSSLLAVGLAANLKADLPSAVFVFAHYAALARSLESRENEPETSISWVFLSGILCGGAVGHKLTAGAAFLASSAIIAWVDFSKGKKFLLSLYWLIGNITSMGPWLLWSWAISGNPFFPYLNGLFNLSQSSFFAPKLYSSLPILGFKGLIRHFLILSGITPSLDVLPAVWGPTLLFTGLAPFCLQNDFPDSLRLVLTGSILGWICLSTQALSARYSLGFIAFSVCAPFALMFSRALMTGFGKWVKSATVTLLLLCFHQTLLSSFTWDRFCAAFYMVLSGVSPGDMLSRDELGDNLRWMGHLINTRTEEGDSVLCIGTRYHFGIERRLFYNSYTESNKGNDIPPLVSGCKDHVELASRLKSMGVGHLLIRWKGAGERANFKDIEKLQSLCVQDMVLRWISPNNEIYWFTFKELNPSPARLAAGDILEFPGMGFEEIKRQYDLGNLKGAQAMAEMAVHLHMGRRGKFRVYSLLTNIYNMEKIHGIKLGS